MPTRSCRNVWTIATAPYIHAHFATYPPALAERCIRAGTSERGCCSQCGKPWVRVTERTAIVIDRSERTHPMGRYEDAERHYAGAANIHHHRLARGLRP